MKKLPITQDSSTNIAFTDVDRNRMEIYMRENNFPLYLFTRYMYYAFIRPKELRMLRVKHVDTVGKYILVPGEISKNRKTESTPIIQPLLTLIDLAHHRPNDYLFGAALTPGKGTCSENTPYNWHVEALEAVGLKDQGYTLYSWKHTGAVNAYLSGVGIKQLQSLLRHSSVQITDIYLKSLGLRTDPNIENYNW